MTTLVHTADVHLRPETDERWAALQAVFEAALDHDADVVTIGGDLFDRPEDVDSLRSRLREDLFTDQPFEILLIPGNHDVEAFSGDLFFGDACTVLTATDAHFETWTAPDGTLRVVGVPYEDTATDGLLVALEDREPFDGTDMLLFHGSLDAPIDADTGDEGAYRYFPVTEAELAPLGFDYYFAGHYHGPHRREFDTGAAFVYPGTPASTRSSETGQRQAVVLEPGRGVQFEPLEIFHHLERTVTVTPGAEAAELEAIADWVDTTVTPQADATVIVDGLIEMAETTFAERLADAAGPATVRHRTTSVEAVIDHPVLAEFRERLGEQDWDEETRTDVWLRTLRAASAVHTSGGLRR